MSPGPITPQVSGTYSTPSCLKRINLDFPLTAHNTGWVMKYLDGYNTATGGYEVAEAPAGVALVIVQMASGTVNPDTTPVFPAMGDVWFTRLAFPYFHSVVPCFS